MKRVALNAVLMLVTFALGVVIDLPLRQPKSEPQINKVPLPRVETVSLPPPVEPKPPVSTPDPHFILDYDPEKFSPWAVFLIMGSTPKAFAEVDSIESGLVGTNSGYLQLNTLTKDGEYDGASATFALVTEQRMFFVTSKTRYTEVEYRFDGEFLTTDFDSLAGKKKAVLRGTLTKMKNGRTIAQHTFSFRTEHLGC